MRTCLGSTARCWRKGLRRLCPQVRRKARPTNNFSHRSAVRRPGTDHPGSTPASNSPIASAELASCEHIPTRFESTMDETGGANVSVGQFFVMSGFAGLRVLALESRRASEIEELIATYGGKPVVAPALREVPLDSNT